MMEVVNVEVDANGSNEEAVQKILEPLANGTEAEQQQQEGGEPLIGKKLRKKFGRKFYSGTVAEFEPDTNWYKVIYEDGDGEELEWSELKPLLLPDTGNETKKRRGGGAPVSKSGSKKRKTKALEDVERSAAEAEAKDEQDEAEEKSEQETELTAVDGEIATENEASEEEEAKKPGKKRGAKAKKKPVKTQPSSSPRKKRARAAEATTPRKSSRLTKTPLTGVVSTSKRKQRSPKGKSPVRASAVKSSPSPASKGKKVVKATPEVASPNQGLERGEKLRGRRIEKEFDGKMYTGEIRNYDRSRRYYKIHYEDGDEEELVWKEVEELLLPVDGEDHRSGGNQNHLGASTSATRPKGSKTVITKTVRKTKVVHTRKVVTRSDQKKRRQR